MKWIALILPLIIAAAAHAEPTPLSSASAELRWINGETIPGELREASATEAAWKSPLFEDPLELRWSVLQRIDQPLAAIAPEDPYSILLRDGSRVYGDLVSITEENFALRSARHGSVVLKRSEVLSIRRRAGGSLLLAGPNGDAGWDAAAPNGSRGNMNNLRVQMRIGTAAAKSSRGPVPAIAPILAGPGGALVLPYWNRSATLDLALPELLDLEFTVSSAPRPDFELILGDGSKQVLRIETWDNQLVLTAADQFKVIRELESAEREIALRVCWDRKAGKCSIFTPQGALLAEWSPPGEERTGASGLILRNKGRNLSLDFLRVRKWDGSAPPKFDAHQPRIELADGRIMEGEITGSTPDALNLRPRGQEAEVSFPRDAVDAIIISTDALPPGKPAATFTYADGTVVLGSVASIKDGRALIETSFSEGPLLSEMPELRQLLIRNPAPVPGDAPQPLATLDKLVLQKTVLHGKLLGAGDASPRWAAVGSVHPATPARSLEIEVTRAFPPDAQPPTAPALFFTASGDVLPGSLRAVDRSGIEVESSIFEAAKLPPEEIDAVQFGGVAGIGPRGFDDPGWRILKGDEKSVRRTDGTLAMDPGTAFGHPTAMQSDEFKFSFENTGFSTVRLRLFCAGTDATRSVGLILAHFSNQLCSAMESADDQIDNQFQTSVPSDQPVQIQLVVLAKQIELYVNGSLAQKFSIPPGKRAGAGLIIEPASIWGNGVSQVALAHFSAGSTLGRTWLPDVNPETKLQALTVPRFRKDDAPRHALIALNGDVLHGEIEAVTAGYFGFRSGLETFRVPRDRVKAAIWLKKPAEEAAKPAVENPVKKELDRIISLHTRYGNASLEILTSVLQREAPELKFKLPKLDDNLQFPMQFGGQTIGDAIDELCSLFGLSSRIATDGTIILELRREAPPGLVEKVYWLKPGAFPSSPSAREILAGKGLPLPDEATVEWQAKPAQLVMRNTAENQGKLQKLLASDFGGSLGSPTHWLILANGGRMALAVDQFGANAVFGRHPIYGRCTVPLSEIYQIRTTLPESSPSMEALEDWSLVFAPEPTLPEVGGESSALLGKAAPVFKLPLLAGGEFDLAQQKGGVIVLDFWATWCGPCVKSLPGLIEAIAAFPPEQVKLIGLNQAEAPEEIKRFLQTRQWNLNVALDSAQNVAKQYGVDGIPHTVVIGPDQKVAWVKTGYSADGDAEISAAIKRLLAPPAGSKPAPTP